MLLLSINRYIMHASVKINTRYFRIVAQTHIFFSTSSSSFIFFCPFFVGYLDLTEDRHRERKRYVYRGRERERGRGRCQQLYKPFNAAICLYLVRVRCSNIFLLPRKVLGPGTFSWFVYFPFCSPPFLFVFFFLWLLSSAFDVYCKRDSMARAVVAGSANVIIKVNFSLLLLRHISHAPIPIFMFDSRCRGNDYSR